MKVLSYTAIWAVAFLCMPLTLFGQNALQGTVADSATHETLVGANVYLNGTAFGSVTDREGRFRITGIPQGTYILRASYVGYRPKEIQARIPEEASKPISLLLRPPKPREYRLHPARHR